MRYLTPDDFRVLGAVDAGSRNHELVPTKLIHQLSGMRAPSHVDRCISTLAKAKLIGRLPGQRQAYDGYRLTGMGADHLAMRVLAKRGVLAAVGNQIGVGKEADVYACATDAGDDCIVKFHRLGRTSFRNAARTKRNYGRSNNKRGNPAKTDNTDVSSWQYLSRMSAEREHAFMVELHARGYPIPKPFGRQKHCVVMSLVDALPLNQIDTCLDPELLLEKLLGFAERLARDGLVHGDLNEFNILVAEDGTPTVIDFPQMISIDHDEAQEQFERDVNALVSYFARKFDYHYTGQLPDLQQIRKDLQEETNAKDNRIDRVVAASGSLTKRQLKELDQAFARSKAEERQKTSEDEVDDGSEDADEEEGEAEGDSEDEVHGSADELDDEHIHK
ncbi:Serine/threonine-protein kinase rio2 [Savitreella phatthalungensis]